MSNVILAIAEQTDGQFRKVTYEALSEGKKIASANSCELAAVVIGSHIAEAAAALAKYGADRIIVADDRTLPRVREDGRLVVVELRIIDRVAGLLEEVPGTDLPVE